MTAMSVLPRLRAPFRAIARTIVPEARTLTEAEWEEVERIVEEAIARRPIAMRRQLAAFIRVVELLPVTRFGRTFSALDDQRRTRVLRALENAPVLVVRRGFWGLRTLIFMGFYARPGVAAELGYRASARGWEARA
jgi:hypothetical protein